MPEKIDSQTEHTRDEMYNVAKVAGDSLMVKITLKSKKVHLYLFEVV